MYSSSPGPEVEGLRELGDEGKEEAEAEEDQQRCALPSSQQDVKVRRMPGFHLPISSDRYF